LHRQAGRKIDPDARDGPSPGVPTAECLRALVEEGVDATVLVERNGGVRWASAGATRILGRSLDDFVGAVHMDLVHPADRDVVATAFSLTLKGATTGPLNYRLRDGRGRWRRVEVLMADMLDRPTVEAVVLSIREPRERLDVLEGGLEAEDRFRRLLEQSPDGVFVVDEDYTITYATTMGARLLAVASPGAVLGQPLFRFFHPSNVDGLKQVLGRVLHTGVGSGVKQGTILRLDGRPIDVEITAGAVTHAGRRAVQLVARDVTDRVEAEREAERARVDLERLAADAQESNRELASLGAIAFHDLMQPMQTLFGYLQMISDGKAADEEQVRHWAARCGRSVQRMHGMLESLASRSQAGPRGLELSPVDCRALLSDVLADLVPAISAADALVEVDALPTLVADAAQLRELLQNLIANGLKFTRAGVRPKIHVTAAREDGAWRLVVADNGVGIPAAFRTEIFEPFRRLAGSGRPGSGLGLYTCKRIAQRHGGAIWAERGEPAGTRMCVRIPDLADPNASA